MSKKNLAKRLIALVAIVAMFAAMTVTASAAPQYSSSTLYVDADTVKVTTYVTGIESGDEVTYYAKNGNDDVYVNQYTSSDTWMSKSYVADLEDISNLSIKMAKVNSDFDEYAEITGVNNGTTSIKMTCGDWVKNYYEGDVLPEIDDIINLDGFPMTIGDKRLSGLTATIGDDTYELYLIDVWGTVSFISPVHVQVGMDGKATVINQKGDQYSTNELNIVLTPEYNGAITGSDVTFSYIGIQTATSYTVDGVIGKLFATAYTVNNVENVDEYGIEILDGDDVGQYSASGVSINADNSASYAIAFVNPDLATFTYRPYVIVDGKVVYGNKKTANIE